MPRNRDREPDRLYSLEGSIAHYTDKAYLFAPKDDPAKKVWLPRSQCEFEAGLMTLPEWLLIEKNLENLVDYENRE